MVGRPEGLGGDGEGRVHRGRGWEERCIDDEQILDVVGTAPGIEHRRLRFGAEDRRAALVRGIEVTGRDRQDEPGSNLAKQRPW